MVTYIEKQQMKHLHEQDPEFWTADKLAECFPASTEIVKVMTIRSHYVELGLSFSFVHNFVVTRFDVGCFFLS